MQLLSLSNSLQLVSVVGLVMSLSVRVEVLSGFDGVGVTGVTGVVGVVGVVGFGLLLGMVQIPFELRVYPV